MPLKTITIKKGNKTHRQSFKVSFNLDNLVENMSRLHLANLCRDRSLSLWPIRALSVKSLCACLTYLGPVMEPYNIALKVTHEISVPKLEPGGGLFSEIFQPNKANPTALGSTIKKIIIQNRRMRKKMTILLYFAQIFQVQLFLFFPYHVSVAKETKTPSLDDCSSMFSWENRKENNSQLSTCLLSPVYFNISVMVIDSQMPSAFVQLTIYVIMVRLTLNILGAKGKNFVYNL